MNRSRAGYRIVIAFVAAIALGVGASNWESRVLRGPGPLATATTVIIPRGGAPAIGRRLEAAGVVSHWWMFELAIQVFDRGRPLHAGEYAFAPGQTLRDVVTQLRDGRVIIHRLTVPEGLSVAQILALIAGDSALSGPMGETPAEGSLMPDTYNFVLADSRAEMIARMRHAMDRALAASWADRAPGLPLASPQAALTLASIIEKETAIPEERPKVAAVFLNRLSRGMRLQADPTVIYALTGGKATLGRPLDHADLAVDSPYNSYRNDGLPPTPIDCPGRSALHAALHPDRTDLLYFVADGSGRHAFAETLDDHNRNVTRLRQLEHTAPAPGGTAN